MASGSAFVPTVPRSGQLSSTRGTIVKPFMTIVSPFDESADASDDGANVATKTETSIGDGPFELTWEVRTSFVFGCCLLHSIFCTIIEPQKRLTVCPTFFILDTQNVDMVLEEMRPYVRLLYLCFCLLVGWSDVERSKQRHRDTNLSYPVIFASFV